MTILSFLGYGSRRTTSVDGRRPLKRQVLRRPRDGPPAVGRSAESESVDVERPETGPGSGPDALMAYLKLAQSVLVAAGGRDAAADARDGVAETREREADLARMLSRASDAEYGIDWPQRRRAALDRAHARTDRLSAHEDLLALMAFQSFLGGDQP